jgi:hypothetical protein
MALVELPARATQIPMGEHCAPLDLLSYRHHPWKSSSTGRACIFSFDAGLLWYAIFCAGTNK